MEYTVTNLDYLIELSDNNSEFMIDMISTFLDQTPDFIQSMKKAYNEGNYLEIKKIAHKMKPTLPMMGIEKFNDDVITLEKIGLSGVVNPKFDEIIQSLEQTLELAYSELKQRLKDFA